MLKTEGIDVSFGSNIFAMRLLLSFAVLLVSTATWAQTDVYLNINHLFGEDQFTANTPTMTDDGYEVSIGRIEYYISNVVITHDGGQTVNLGELTLLVDASAPEGFYLGNLSVNQLENISFSIGVLEELNHLDPSSYDDNHPLANQAPSMHWGWTSGYKFLCFEGMAEANGLIEIHALGDENYMNQSHELNVEAVSGIANIALDADYLKLTTNLDMSEGLFLHGTTGPAVDILLNMRSLVFSSDAYLGSTELTQTVFTVFPNPATANVTVVPSTEGVFQLEMLDLTGKVVTTYGALNGTSVVSVNELSAGIYFIRCVQGQRVTTSKLVVK